jgi:hypothetical protein
MAGAQAVTCSEQLKLNILAMSCLLPGLNTLLSNCVLSVSSSEELPHGRDHELWRFEYHDGERSADRTARFSCQPRFLPHPPTNQPTQPNLADPDPHRPCPRWAGCVHEIYEQKCPGQLAGYTFGEACLLLHRMYCMILFAKLDDKTDDHSPIGLFPAEQQLQEDDVIYLFACDQTDADQLQNITAEDIMRAVPEAAQRREAAMQEAGGDATDADTCARDKRSTVARRTTQLLSSVVAGSFSPGKPGHGKSEPSSFDKSESFAANRGAHLSPREKMRRQSATGRSPASTSRRLAPAVSGAQLGATPEATEASVVGKAALLQAAPSPAGAPAACHEGGRRASASASAPASHPIGEGGPRRASSQLGGAGREGTTTTANRRASRQALAARRATHLLETGQATAAQARALAAPRGDSEQGSPRSFPPTARISIGANAHSISPQTHHMRVLQRRARAPSAGAAVVGAATAADFENEHGGSGDGDGDGEASLYAVTPAFEEVTHSPHLLREQRLRGHIVLVGLPSDPVAFMGALRSKGLERHEYKPIVVLCPLKPTNEHFAAMYAAWPCAARCSW